MNIEFLTVYQNVNLKKKNDKNSDIFSIRYDRIKMIVDQNSSIFNYCKILDQINYTKEKFEELQQIADENNWEGLMLRKNTIYEGKRTNALLKVKKMQDSEFTVISLENKPFRIIGPDKIEKTIDCLSNVTIQYTPTSVGNVGSGFTLNERIHFYNNPEEILHKKITVQYFEKTERSLRFPVFKGIRFDQ